MSLTPGDRLGPYEILAPIGAGGMGEVWKAHDSRLGRDVAIKVSAERFSERFEREARAVAALNHPNICTLYDVGPNYLVMELIEGEAPRGPYALQEALHFARQIADALEAAHEKGIVHRDLKPGNIKIKPDGTVKVLDFGLAKMVAVTSGPPTDDSPTLSMGATQAGGILGTAAYMSPEQARGKSVDRRADIWAFGVVLHEMLTGKKLFHGENVTDTLASVVKSEPDLSPVPDKVRGLLTQCLQKDPKKRLRDIGDAWALLEIPPAKPKLSPWPWALAAVSLLAALISTFLWLGRPVPDLQALQFSLEPPAGNQYTNIYGATAVSPDGRYLVFSAAAGAAAGVLWLRPFGSLDARPLPGTNGGNFPFWSPDSKSLAFVANGKLRRLDISGGAPLVLCDVTPGNAVGGAWNEEGTILFAGPDGLSRVAASGGAPVKVTQVDKEHQESAHSQPQFLPDGTRFLYYIESSNSDMRGIFAGSLDHTQVRVQVLATEHKAIYTAPHDGHPGALLWLQGLKLMAQAFDPASLRLTGHPSPIADDVSSPIGLGGRAAFFASDAGLLAWRAGASIGESRLVWMSREGKRLEEAAPKDRYGSLTLSPDGKRLAIGRTDATNNPDVWVYDLSSKVMTRLTFDPADEAYPVWSPDGRQIAYYSEKTRFRLLYRKDVGGDGQEEQLTQGTFSIDPSDWSPDGKYIVFAQLDPKTGYDLWALPLEPDATGARKPVSLARTHFTEGLGRVSPDGKWLAYRSNESGSGQVYIQAFPTASGKRQVSNGGGLRPQWRGDGKEIFYESVAGTQSKIMAAEIRTGPGGIEVATPRELFSVPAFNGIINHPWAVTSNGQRFLVEEAVSTSGPGPLIVMQNWQAALKK